MPLHWTRSQNIERDPFEQAVTGPEDRAQPRRVDRHAFTAYLYDWNMLPLGQQLWLKWFETLREFPPMQAPASYNLDQIEQQVKSQRHIGPVSD